MYGTQDASHIWQNDYVSLFVKEGFVRGRHCAASLYHHDEEIRVMCHGDDFLVLASDPGMEIVDKLLRGRYTVKQLGSLGWEPGDAKKIHVLNRDMVAGRDEQGVFVDIVPDPRHAEQIVQDAGLGKSKSTCVTPREKLKDEVVVAGTQGTRLDKTMTTQYRSTVMRLQYLAQDRCDLAETAKCMAQRMKEPTISDLTSVKRVARYLAGRKRAKLRFRAQPLPEKVTMKVDSDWMGDPITRKSTTGAMAFLGTHCCRASSTLQSIVSLSVGESEFYAVCKGSAVGLSLVSMLAELGIFMKLEILSDSSTARSLSSRLGVGRNKHMQSRYLWVQERVQAKHLSVHAIPTLDNSADLLTKPVGRQTLDKFCGHAGLLFF